MNENQLSEMENANVPIFLIPLLSTAIHFGNFVACVKITMGCDFNPLRPPPHSFMLPPTQSPSWSFPWCGVCSVQSFIQNGAFGVSCSPLCLNGLRLFLTVSTLRRFRSESVSLPLSLPPLPRNLRRRSTLRRYLYEHRSKFSHKSFASRFIRMSECR